MVSSPDRDKDTNSTDNQPKPDNPFIKFRQFADTQISSLLQGIIGLPSALSKRAPEDPRWAGVDDGLRRRDELQARQKELKESESRKSHRQTPYEAGETFTRNADRTYWSDQGYQPLGLREHKDLPPTKDLPFYSAVKKSLFAHLQQPDFDPPAWEENEYLSQLESPKSRDRQNPAQINAYNLGLTQLMVHNELNESGVFRSEHSLLPYLMLSPYSPIRLESTQAEEENFSYCNAFEDLVLTSEPTDESSPWKYMMSELIQPRTGSAYGNREWIGKLFILGLLQKEEGIEQDCVETACDCRPLQSMLLTKQNEAKQLEAITRDEAWSSSTEQTSVASAKPAQKASKDGFQAAKSPRTEQEMYDHFLKWASSPRAVKDVFQAGEAFLTSLEDDEISGRKTSDGGVPAPSSLMKEILEVTKAFRELSQAGDTPSVPEQTDRTQEPKTASEKPDRVVSSSTTTEQTVHEDGSIETSVTVWKKFSNGRETSTTTLHCEDPAAAEDAQPQERGFSSQHPDNASKASEKGKQTEKSGWFWN